MNAAWIVVGVVGVITAVSVGVALGAALATGALDQAWNAIVAGMVRVWRTLVRGLLALGGPR